MACRAGVNDYDHRDGIQATAIGEPFSKGRGTDDEEGVTTIIVFLAIGASWRPRHFSVTSPAEESMHTRNEYKKSDYDTAREALTIRLVEARNGRRRGAWRCHHHCPLSCQWRLLASPLEGGHPRRFLRLVRYVVREIVAVPPGLAGARRRDLSPLR